jgi:SAM-dependent methyltransferase
MAAAGPFVWQTCLDVEGQNASHYQDHVNEALLGGVVGSPRRVLELGCATGAFGQALKQRFPGASVVGVEAGRAAAEVAATRLDRVLCRRLEALDLAAEGFAHGEFDALIAADILEHLVNPWDVLVKVKPFLAPDALVLLSIPNVRNLVLVETLLVKGAWPYAERGLLDITHLRFFTLSGIRQMVQETGYRFEGHAATLAPALAEFYRSTQGQQRVTIDFGRLKLHDVTRQELDELCAVQFLVRARPA